jgi:uncharacterized SAM-binding protein YcdF (DUF218 family)
MPTNIDKNAQIIWNYMKMNQKLSKADAIFVLCSLDTRVAKKAAELYLDGYANEVIVSGGVGILTKDIFDTSEAQVFTDIMIKMGVPKEKIIIEDKSTNTGENITFTYNLLNKLNKRFDSFILVQKPYMERRTYATFMKQWPDKDTRISVTSPDIAYNDYFTDDMPKDLVINIMVGDLQRIKEYPAKGFQIEQDIPEDVIQAYNELIGSGYTKHLIQ